MTTTLIEQNRRRIADQKAEARTQYLDLLRRIGSNATLPTDAQLLAEIQSTLGLTDEAVQHDADHYGAAVAALAAVRHAQEEAAGLPTRQEVDVNLATIDDKIRATIGPLLAMKRDYERDALRRRDADENLVELHRQLNIIGSKSPNAQAAAELARK